MEVKDPGHHYLLDQLDQVSGWVSERGELKFVKRTGDNFPGNEGTGYAGTTTQEVLRALIDRTRYVVNQKPHPQNHIATTHLRCALYALEERAAEVRGEDMKKWRQHHIKAIGRIEEVQTCDWCGHIGCTRKHE